MYPQLPDQTLMLTGRGKDQRQIEVKYVYFSLGSKLANAIILQEKQGNVL